VALSPHPYFRHPLDRLVKNNCLYTIEPTPDGYEVVCKYSLQWKIGNRDEGSVKKINRRGER